MTVITISREPGSEGTYIARKTAEALGYHFADKDTIEDVLLQYGFADFEAIYESAPGLAAGLDERRNQATAMLNQVIKALASHGDVVILGRGSFAALAGLTDVLNVRVQPHSM